MEKVYIIVIALGSVLATVAGILLSMDTDLRPTISSTALLKAIVASIVGGVGNIRGALFAGLLIGFIENFAILFIGSGWRDAIPLVLIVLFMLLKPSVFGIEEKGVRGHIYELRFQYFNPDSGLQPAERQPGFDYGPAAMFHMGHGGFFAVGAYAGALLATSLNLPFFLELLLAGAVAAVFGMIIGFPSIRLKGDYITFCSYGFAVVIYTVANNWMDVTNGPIGISGLMRPEIFGISFASLPM